MAWDLKRIETRDWGTDYRGLVAIHATKAFPSEAAAACADNLLLVDALAGHGISSCEAAAKLPRGAILCVVELVRCADLWGHMPLEGGAAGYKIGIRERGKGARTIDISAEEYAFGNYADGRFAWFTEGCRPLPEPVPFTGAQGLRDLDPATEIRLCEALNLPTTPARLREHYNRPAQEVFAP
jgi:hypothetical protein